MSEFSESYHFRADAFSDESRLTQALASTDIHGVLYATTTSWRTFAPAAELIAENESEAIGSRISLALNTPVLEYRFAEDYYWAFSIWKRGQIVSAYSCGWTEGDIEVDDSALDLHSLAAFGVPDSAHRTLRDLLNPEQANPEDHLTAAPRFAQAIGLEHFENVGPATIELDFDEILRDGVHTVIDPVSSPMTAKEIAAKKAAMLEAYNNPPSVPVQFSGASITASEAFEIAKPHAIHRDAAAKLFAVHSDGRRLQQPADAILSPSINELGATVNGGNWTVAFVLPTESHLLRLTLFPADGEGRMEITRMGGVQLPDPINSSERWIDSSAAVAAAEPQYLASDLAKSTHLVDRFSQLMLAQGPFAWYVTYVCQHSDGRRENLMVTVDASDGRVTETRRG